MRAISLAKFEEDIVNEDAAIATESVIGIYSAIYKLPYVLILFFNPISQALYPHISVKFAESFDIGRKSVRKAASYVMPVFALGGIIICLFREVIIRLAFGTEYLEYHVITIPLIIWMMLSVANNFMGVQFLVASGNQKCYSQAVTIGACITVGLNIVMGIMFDVYGVALAAALGELSLTVALVTRVRTVNRIKS